MTRIVPVHAGTAGDAGVTCANRVARLFNRYLRLLPSLQSVMKFMVFSREGRLVDVESPKVVKSDDEWRDQLGEETFRIARAKGTERPFCGNLLDNKQEGVYACICCRLPLFSSSHKFNSGTGWPSFFAPVAEENITTAADNSLPGRPRIEILCARCDCHLGHVFPDGPPPTHKRFCVNSESLTFTPTDRLAELAEAEERVTR